MKSLSLSLVFLSLFYSSPNRHTGLIELIQFHQITKTNFAIQDAYKLIYQSVFGVSHILDNLSKAKKYLQKEFDSIRASTEEPLIEPISLDSEIVRINLRPFKAKYKSIDTLFQVMILSAREINGTLTEFLLLWNEFKQAVEKKQFNFTESELIEFDKKIKSKNYPVVHHSEQYRAANKPAYRVVKNRVFKDLFVIK